jgi:hypothetical protein
LNKTNDQTWLKYLEVRGTVNCTYTILISRVDSRAQSAFAADDADSSGDGKAEDYKQVQNSLYMITEL